MDKTEMTSAQRCMVYVAEHIAFARRRRILCCGNCMYFVPTINKEWEGYAGTCSRIADPEEAKKTTLQKCGLFFDWIEL